MLDTQNLMLNLIFSSIGLGYYLYGKKQKKYVTLFSGVGLMVYSYFVADTTIVVLVGGVLCAVPFVLKES